MFIKRVEFAEVPTETGENGSEIVMAFKENYYNKYDIFKIIDYYATLLNKKEQVNENVKERMTQVLNTCFHYGYIKLLPNAFYKLLKQYGGYDLRARAFRLALKTKVLYQLSKCLKKW